MEFYEDAYLFLKVSGYKVNKGYLKEWMQSHPNYPALISFTDLLDEFEIDHKVIKVERMNQLKTFPKRAFIHTVSNKGKTGFKTIKKSAKGKFKVDDLKEWTGIALLLNKSSKLNHYEHSKIYKKGRDLRIIGIIILTLLVTLLSFNQFLNFQWVLSISFILFLIGLFFSILIVEKEIGIKSNVSDFFCSTNNSGCNKILYSKYGKFGQHLSLGDLTTIYFAGLILCISFLPELKVLEKVSLLTITLIPGLLSTPISIYYQIKLKSFCLLCTALIGVLWLQAINLSVYYMENTVSLNDLSFTLNAIIGIAMSFSIAALWLILKPKLVQNQSISHQNVMLRKWRQNPFWFDALLPLHKKIDDSPWKREIQYGNPMGPLQFLIVSNPFCEYCAIAHMNLERILDRHPNDIGVRIRFYLNPSENNPKNMKYEAVLKILNAYENIVWSKEKKKKSQNAMSRKIITDWYELNEYNWEKKYVPHTNQKSLSEIPNKIIQDSIVWCNRAGIEQTPSFFVNGHEMPNPHTFNDVFSFITDYIEILKSKKQYSD